MKVGQTFENGYPKTILSDYFEFEFNEKGAIVCVHSIDDRMCRKIDEEEAEKFWDECVLSIMFADDNSEYEYQKRFYKKNGYLDL